METVVMEQKTNGALLPPPQQKLVDGLIHAKELLRDIVGKQYLHELSQKTVLPLPKELDGIANLQIFRIT